MSSVCLGRRVLSCPAFLQDLPMGSWCLAPKQTALQQHPVFVDFYPCFQLTNTIRVHNCQRWIGSAPPSMHRFPTSFLHLPTVHLYFPRVFHPFPMIFPWFPHHFPLGCGECDIVADGLQVVQLVQPGGGLHDLSICGNQHERTLKKEPKVCLNMVDLPSGHRNSGFTHSK